MMPCCRCRCRAGLASRPRTFDSAAFDAAAAWAASFACAFTSAKIWSIAAAAEAPAGADLCLALDFLSRLRALSDLLLGLLGLLLVSLARLSPAPDLLDLGMLLVLLLVLALVLRQALAVPRLYCACEDAPALPEHG